MTEVPEEGSLEQLLGRRGRRLRILVLATTSGCVLGLAVFALLREFPARPFGVADDFRVFFAAAELVGRGINPYHLGALQAAEQAAHHYPASNPTLDTFADPPVVARLLLPFSYLPFWISYALFSAIGAGLLLLTLTLLARDLGWRHIATLSAGVILSWIGLLGFLDGQFDALLFAAVVGSMLLAWHERSLAAGAVLALILLKPTLLWPAPIFLFLALWPDRGRALRFAAGFVAMSAIAALACWPWLGAWTHQLGAFASGVGSRQPDLAGLPGLLRAAPASWHLGTGVTAPLTLLLIGLALVAMAVFGAWMMLSPDWRRVSPVGRIAWAVALSVGIWLLVTPYAHPNDDLLLLPLFMLTVGRDSRRLHGLGLALAAGTMALLLLTWPGGVVPWPLALVVFGVLALVLWVRRTDIRLTGFGAGMCLMSVALLPPVWDFHLLSVGLAPVAVGILVVEGARTCWMEVGGAGTGPAYFADPTALGITPKPAGA